MKKIIIENKKIIAIPALAFLVWFFVFKKKGVQSIVSNFKTYPPISDNISEERVLKISPKIRNNVRGFFQEAENQGIKLRLTDGFRSFEEQDALYSKGRTTAGNIVTNAKGGQSYHNYGLAFDVVDMELWWNGADWQKIGKIGKSFGFEWGGDWSGFVDKPHFQKKFGQTTSQLLENLGNNIYT
jgi:peptidoglycan L-alanyl-D-glutamate endopeptidase CwlK